ASFHASAVDSSPTSLTIFATQSPSLHLDKVATESTYSSTSNTLHYTYTNSNNRHLTVSDPSTATDNNATTKCTLAAASLAPGFSMTRTGTHPVPPRDLAFGAVPLPSFPPRRSSDLASFHASAVASSPTSLTIFATQSPSLHLDKVATESTYSSTSNTLHYTY